MEIAESDVGVYLYQTVAIPFQIPHEPTSGSSPADVAPNVLSPSV